MSPTATPMCLPPTRRLLDAARPAKAILFSFMLALVQCQASGGGEGRADAAANLHTEVEREATQTGVEPRLDLPRPARLEAANVKPLSGEELVKASRPIEQIIADLPRPDYLPAADEAKPAAPVAPVAPVAPEPQTPDAAIKHYALGRAAFRDGQPFEALQHLEQAQRLAPRSAPILRLTGAIYFLADNPVKGASYLERAVRIEPNDAQSLFMLGRFAHDQGRIDEAIVTLAHAAGIEDEAMDPAAAYLLRFYLGQALLNRGYDAAAVDQLLLFLTLPEQFGATTRMYRELAFMVRRRGKIHEEVGDALVRLGRFADALNHYALAEGQPVVDPADLTARRVYTLLVLRRPRTAEQTLVGAIRAAESIDPFLELAPYVAEQGGDGDRFAKLLTELYEQSDRPRALALAVAGVLPDEAAAAFLADHLRAKPTEVSVYSTFVKRFAASRPGDVAGATVRLITDQPAAVRSYVQMLIDAKPDADALLAAVDALPREQSQTSAAHHLRGVLLESAGRNEQAMAAYQRAIESDAQFLAPRLAAIDLNMRLGRDAEALTLIEAIAQQDDPAIQFAMARALANMDKLDQAVAIMDKLIAAQPRNIDYSLFKAELQTAAGDYRAAERTLWAALDQNPSHEPTYEALFTLYNQHVRADASLHQRLLRQAMKEVPNARITQLEIARQFVLVRRLDQAEALLRRVLDMHPGDEDAVGMLVRDVFAPQGKWPEAEKLLKEQIDKNPDSGVLMGLYAAVAEQLGKFDEFSPVYEAFLKRQKPSAQNAIRLYSLYVESKRYEQAVEALEQAATLEKGAQRKAEIVGTIARTYVRMDKPQLGLQRIDQAIRDDPARAPDYYYVKANIHSRMNDDAGAEAALHEALKIDPNHPGANNDLGYTWADKGINLDEALQMTLKAVASDRENPAYIDSLGWVLYKQGKFDEAVIRLREGASKPGGQDPVIVDHLGDALWRAGQKPQALQQWRQAVQLAELLADDARPDIEEVKAAAQKKIDAATNNQEPPVAEIPER